MLDQRRPQSDSKKVHKSSKLDGKVRGKDVTVADKMVKLTRNYNCLRRCNGTKKIANKHEAAVRMER
jgi:hypothetical protein